MMTLDPDYARILTQARSIAYTYGWAITLHGSGMRDLDLVMIPWTSAATNEVAAIVHKIARITGTTIKGEPGIKPHGRRGWNLMVDEVRWVDLSVMPCIQAPMAQAICLTCGVDRMVEGCGNGRAPCTFRSDPE